MPISIATIAEPIGSGPAPQSGDAGRSDSAAGQHADADDANAGGLGVFEQSSISCAG